MIKLGSNSIGGIYLGTNPIGKAYLGSNLVYVKGGEPGPPPGPAMTLVRYWDGSDSPNGSLWADRIVGQNFQLFNSTHETSYYEFINSTPSSSTSSANMPGALPDLGYYWKIELDFEFKTQANTTMYVPIDFGGIGVVASGACGIGLSLDATTLKWILTPKFNGNDSYDLYNADYTNFPSDSDASTIGNWVRRKITFGVKPTETDGYYSTYLNIEDVGEAESSTPYSGIQFNRWTSGNTYIARPFAGVNTTNRKAATSVRFYSIKVYKQQT